MGIYGRRRHRVETDRIRALTTGPLVETLHGTQARIRLLPEDDLRLLLQHFGCGIEELDFAMWTSKRNRRRRPARTNLVPAFGLFRSRRPTSG